MRLYISGPMRGVENFNYPAFDAAQRHLENQGHTCFNPAQQDRLRGFNFMGMAGDEDLTAYGFDIKAALLEDLTWIAQTAEAVVMLPGWRYSKGAMAEVYLAKAIFLPTVELKYVVSELWTP